MNKKRSVMRLFLFSLLLVSVIVFFNGSLSGAVVDKDTYLLGENVKVDMEGVKDYTIQIVSPTQTYTVHGSDDSFVFKPEEAGEYKIIVGDDENVASYPFIVLVDSDKQVKKREVETVSVSGPKNEFKVKKVSEKNEPLISVDNSIKEEQDFQNDLEKTNLVSEINEYYFEFDVVEGEKVAWSIDTYSIRGERIKLPAIAENIQVKNENGELIDFEIEKRPIYEFFSKLISSNRNLGNMNIFVDSEGDIKINYQTPPPEKEIEKISKQLTKVVVKSPPGTHYENVKVRYDFQEKILEEDLSVYWDEEEVYLGFDGVDEDEDGYVDYIVWIVPHLSEQTFLILNEGRESEEFYFDDGNAFLVGERIGFDMRNLGNYLIRIQDPNGEEFLRIGSNDVFTYNVELEGEYFIELLRGGGIYEYSFLTGNEEVTLPIVVGEPVILRRLVNGEIVREVYDAPSINEVFISDEVKRVVISSGDEIPYENVKATTTISEKVRSGRSIEVYWVEEGIFMEKEVFDDDGNELIDRVDWIVPHLSNQTFLIILITKAEHLDSDRDFVEDIFPEVELLDGVWSKEIGQGEYVRVQFEQNLTNVNDITIFPRTVVGNPSIEIYEKDGFEVIAQFDSIVDNIYNKVFLTNLVGTQDTFDLKITSGRVEFDHIIDPASTTAFTGFEADSTNPWDGWLGGSEVTRTAGEGGDYCSDTACPGTGTFGIEIQDDTAGSTLSQTFDLSDICGGGACDEVNISFWAYFDTGNNNGHSLDFKCDGTTLWQCFSNNDPAGDSPQCAGSIEGSWAQYEVSLNNPEQGSCTVDSSVALLFEGEFGNNNQQVWLDGINVTGFYTIVGDVEAPNVTLETPLNESGTVVALNYFYATIDDNVDLDNATLYVWNLTNDLVGTNFTTLSGTSDSANLSYTLPAEGNYSWNYLAFDNSSNSAFNNSNFTIVYSATDVTPPVVTINFPTATTYGENDIPLVFNVTLNEQGDTVYYTLTDGEVNITMSTTDNLTFTHSNDSIADGTYTFIVYANDTSGNRKDGTNVTFEVDAIRDPIGYPSGPVDLRAQSCSKQSQEASQNNFPLLCDGSYPAACDSDRMSCNEGTVETATSDRTGGIDYYGGISIEAFNSTISDCQSVDDVSLCYEFYGVGSQHTCTVGVNANGTWVDTAATCSATAPGVTCINVTSNFNWVCGDFFGASDGSRAQAKAQAVKTTASGTQDWDFDVLYFNVTYTKVDATVPQITLQSPTDDSVIGDSLIYFSADATDDSGLVNATLYLWNSTNDLVGTNFTTISGTSNSTNLSFFISTSGNYSWNYLVTDDDDNAVFATANYSFQLDLAGPTVSLVSPVNGTNITDSFDLQFIFNASDTGGVDSCVFYLDGNPTQTDGSITNNANQTFFQFMTNGQHIWSVACNDSANTFGYSENWTVNVSINQPAFEGRFWESGAQSYTDETATINLNNSRDTGTSNTVAYTISAGQTETLVDAGSWYMTHNGAVIPQGSVIDFSTAFSATNNQILLTWKLAISNETGDTIICQNGDDGAGGEPANQVLETATNSTCISSDTRLEPTDRIKLIINGYNNHGSADQSITHAWEGAFSSFVDVNVTTEGFLSVNTSRPLVDPNIASGEVFNVTCDVSCSIGFCRNTIVYVQYNTTVLNWTNVSASGNIILDGGETNGHVVGNVTTNTIQENFTLQGSSASTNNVRCIAFSDYDFNESTRTQQVTVSVAGAQAPNLTKISPANASWYNVSSIAFIYNITDANDNVANSTLILNGVRNTTNQSTIVLGEFNNFTLTFIDGTYTWNVNSTDLTNLEGSANNETEFYVDTVPPQINLSTPDENEILSISNVEFNFTVTDAMDSVLVCTLLVDSIARNSPFNADNGTLINRTVTGLGAGDHLWNVTCTDEAGNQNISQTRNFSILDSPPTVELITDDNSYFNSANVTLIFNATDNNDLSEARLILNGEENLTNQSIVNNGVYSNFTLENYPEGVYNWTVNVTDTGGFNATDSTIRTFTIDRTSPSINLSLPFNGSFLTGDISFNYTVTDNLDSSLLCNLTIGNYSDNNIASANGSLINRDVTNLPDGFQTWNVSCWDDSGNGNISELRFVNITEFPTVALNTANESFFNSTTFNLTYTPSDNSGLAVCSLYLNGGFNQDNQTTIINGDQNNFSVTTGGGTYTWYVSCNDTFGLNSISETRFFTVDLNGLNVQLLYPPNGSLLFTDTVEFSYNATDDVSNLLNCDILVNNVTVDAFNATNAAETNRSVVFADGGLKYWNVTCFDDALNSYTSVTRNFTLAFAPEVQNSDPFDGIYVNYSTVALEYYVIDDNDNIENSSLYINGVFNQSNQSAIVNDDVNNFTLTFADGYYEWSVNVTDDTNLIGNSSTWNFTVDTGIPTIDLNSPLPDAILDWNNITFNFTSTDNLDPLLGCNLTIENGGSETFAYNVPNGTDYISYAVKSDGNYTWFVECFDWAGNSNLSESRNFSIEAPPNVTLLDPTNGEHVNNSNIDFIYFPEDPIGLFNCSFYLDDLFNDTTQLMTNAENNTFSVTNIAEGRHNWTVECADVAPDLNNFKADPFNFTVDLTPPNVNLLSPENNSNVLREVTFNFTGNDLLDSDLNLSCELYVDGELNVTGITLENGSISSQTTGNYSLGQHTWNVSCEDDATNVGWSEIWTFNVSLPDLAIYRGDIEFNNTSPTENESVTISANVTNLINVTITNISVRFYEGDPDDGGTQIGSDQVIETLGPYSNYTVSLEWGAAVGTTFIFVHVDPPISSNGIIEEVDETNNEANKSITVGAWQVVYGDIDGSSFLELSDESNNSVIKWDTDNYLDGNLYVSDSESQISWLELQAIGKNSADGDVTGDFDDIDVLLNMTDFADSVNSTYLNASGYVNETSYLVFTNSIDEVPITNSTNNSNFVTGILWDTSDDVGDGEFSTDDVEDLIFISSVERDLLGAYGTYDYEMRIPAKLREYDDTNTAYVVFYTELR